MAGLLVVTSVTAKYPLLTMNEAERYALAWQDRKRRFTVYVVVLNLFWLLPLTGILSQAFQWKWANNSAFNPLYFMAVCFIRATRAMLTN